MNKFDEYMNEYIEDVSGRIIKRRHSMSLPRVEFIRAFFDDVYQRGYDEAIENKTMTVKSRRQSHG
ncbi:hypothetical protein [Serratia sp. M24T3]|uniref:Uncharacterized protein n=1 Tax=Rouxiella sp. WC2420 TaxID=3234145 RepID=A0AB39VJJ1_9GAMM|nr:hypothetical protein [Serratia sp. M24T3]EIC83385.1 hypothetical protein SPM24T3_17280 [Serratia sp. M24T3]